MTRGLGQKAWFLVVLATVVTLALNAFHIINLPRFALIVLVHVWIGQLVANMVARQRSKKTNLPVKMNV